MVSCDLGTDFVVLTYGIEMCNNIVFTACKHNVKRMKVKYFTNVFDARPFGSTSTFFCSLDDPLAIVVKHASLSDVCELVFG